MARRGESTKHTGSRTRKLYSRVRARSERITQPPPAVSSSPHVVAAIAQVDEPFDLPEVAHVEREVVAAPLESYPEVQDASFDDAHEDLLRLAETGSDAPPPVEMREPEALPLPPATPDFALASESAHADEERPAEMPSERPVTFELEHHESGFFSVTSAADEGEDEDDDATRPAARPYVGNERRRRRAAQYVSGVLAFCGLVAAAGFASRAAADPHTSISGSAMALSNFDVRAPRTGAAAAAAPASVKSDDVPAPSEAAEVPEAPAPVASAVASTPVPAASTATPASAPAPTDGDAKAEKKAAQQSLERGKLADAIAHGERSVELDPTDGEAWLILGAARQEKGNPLGAREAYGKCLKLGTRGPKNECAAMLR